MEIKGLKMGIETKEQLDECMMSFHQTLAEQMSTPHECECRYCHQINALFQEVQGLARSINRDEEEDISFHMHRDPQ